MWSIFVIFTKLKGSDPYTSSFWVAIRCEKSLVEPAAAAFREDSAYNAKSAPSEKWEEDCLKIQFSKGGDPCLNSKETIRLCGSRACTP